MSEAEDFDRWEDDGAPVAEEADAMHPFLRALGMTKRRARIVFGALARSLVPSASSAITRQLEIDLCAEAYEAAYNRERKGAS